MGNQADSIEPADSRKHYQHRRFARFDVNHRKPKEAARDGRFSSSARCLRALLIRVRLSTAMLREIDSRRATG
jgi:hypothetical protein